MSTIAAIVIAGRRNRSDLIHEKVLPSLVGFDDVLVVGEDREPEPTEAYRYFEVGALSQSTNDGLVKRDVGTLATSCDLLVYLNDDHQLLPGFVDELRSFISQPVVAWDVLVPARWADHPEHGRIRIPNGEENTYCGGHCGVFRRRVVTHRPWAAQNHNRLWDLTASHQQLADGFKFLCYPRIGILDIEKGATPWL